MDFLRIKSILLPLRSTEIKEMFGEKMNFAVQKYRITGTLILIGSLLFCSIANMEVRAETEEIVHTTRFAPIGLRPLDGGNADGLYCNLPCKDYLKFCNENRLVIVQIEDPEPLSELDKICKLPGIDMIFFGPGDFSQVIGDPGNFDNPEIAKTRKFIVETAHKYGKFAGTVSVPSLKDCYNEGYDFVNCGADVAAIGANCNAIRQMFDEAVKQI